MFTALSIVGIAMAAAVSWGVTPPGRRAIAKVFTKTERVGLHRQGTPRSLAELMNKAHIQVLRKLALKAVDRAWIELAPATQRVYTVQNAASWS